MTYRRLLIFSAGMLLGAAVVAFFLRDLDNARHCITMSALALILRNQAEEDV